MINEYDLTHQAQDNVVHLAYFDKERDISFVWNGTEGDLVDVCPGGYAEPVQDRFDLGFELFKSLPLRTCFNIFKVACDRYLATHEEVGQ